MADFSISGRMSVAGLQRQFSKAFGLELRVYKGPNFADPKATLASLSDKKVDDFECKGNTKVGNFETKFEKATGLTVQVATLPSADGNPGTLVTDDLTLSQAAKLGSEQVIAEKEKVIKTVQVEQPTSKPNENHARDSKEKKIENAEEKQNHQNAEAGINTLISAKHKNSDKPKSVSYVPLSSSKKWQPFLKEVCNKMHNAIYFTPFYIIENTYKYEFKTNPNVGTPESFEISKIKVEVNRNFSNLKTWTDFLVREDYLLIVPLDDNFVENELYHIIIFDQSKLDKLYSKNMAVICELPFDLIESRKNYPTLLRHYISRILSKEKIKIEPRLWSAIKQVEPEVYKELVAAFAELAYEEQYLSKYILSDTSIHEISKTYKDFIPTFKALRSQIKYEVNNLSLCPELDLWEEYAKTFIENKRPFCFFLQNEFWSNSQRNMDVFDAVFKYIKKNNQYAYHLSQYQYVNPKDWTEKYLWSNHLEILEYVVNSGRADLADELYLDKIEFEKKFKS